MKNTITSKITAYFINSQVTILLIAALLAFGFMAVLFTPKEENPQIVVPVADVYLSYPGAPVEVVEKTLTTPVEAKIREVTGVEHIYSASSNSGARITVQFFVGQNWEESLFKLQNQLFSYQDQLLPPGVTYIIKPISVDDVPIVTLTLTGEHYTDNQLRRVGERLLADLRSVPNTANLTITGGQPRTIAVDIDPDKLASYRLSLLVIAGELQRENLQLPAGDISLGKNRLFIQGGNLFQSLADVKNTIIGFGAENSPIYLEDAATVKDVFGDRTTISRINYRQDADITYSNPDPDLTPRGPFITQPAITLGIAKKPGTNAVKVARDILKRVEELKTQLPPGVEIAVTRNDGVTASGAVKDLYRSLFLAIVIVVALLIPFLGWRSAAIVAFVIPLTLAGTLGVGWLAGQTINRITLFALILTLGTLVDDAIAITENIHRRFEQPGMNFAQKAQEAIAAASELGSPVILSTITVILAFLPMGFVAGMMGPYMGPIPFNVPVAMVISTILALTVIPFLALRFLKVKHPQRSTTGTRGSQWYTLVMEPLLNSAFRRRFLLLFIAGLFLASLTLPLTQVVKFRMLPKADKDTFLVQMDAPNGTSLAQTNRMVNSLEAILKEERQITNFETYVGTRAPVDFNNLLRGGTATPIPSQAALLFQPTSSLDTNPVPLTLITASGPRSEHIAEIRVHLTNKKSRTEDSETIVLKLRTKLAQIAALNNVTIKLVEDPPGPPVRSTMLAEIYGPDYDQLRQLTSTVRQVFARTSEVVDIDDSVRQQIPLLELVVDREKAKQAGLSTNQIAQELTAAMAGVQVSTLQVPGELTPVPIRLRFSATNRQSVDDLTRIQLPTPRGQLIPLSELVAFASATADMPVFHKNQRPVAYVFGEMGARSSVYAVMDQLLYFWQHPLPEGYWIQWDGEWKLTLDVFRDLGLAMLVAVMLIYLILVGQFRSFQVPLIMLGTIPLATIGILAGFSLNGVYFSATAMIGVIALAGIVVRNAIVLLEFIADKLREGSTLKRAILEAGAVRFRPILLTSVTTMLGTLPLLSDPVWSGLAWTLLSGMLTSSALTLIVIPLVYYDLSGKKDLDEKQVFHPKLRFFFERKIVSMFHPETQRRREEGRWGG